MNHSAKNTWASLDPYIPYDGSYLPFASILRSPRKNTIFVYAANFKLDQNNNSDRSYDILVINQENNSEFAEFSQSDDLDFEVVNHHSVQYLTELKRIETIVFEYYNTEFHNKSDTIQKLRIAIEYAKNNYC